MTATPPVHAVPSWLREVPLAHRGLHGAGRPENSLAAFAAAVAAGVGVELDVHRSRDGVPVVCHDFDLHRVAGRPDRIADLDAAALAAVRLEGTDECLPSLRDVLRVLADVPVMIEIKNASRTATPVEPAIAALIGAHAGPVCVASFNPRSIVWFRRNAPEVVRVLTAGPLDGVPMPGPIRWSLRTLKWVRAADPHAVSYDLAGVDDPVVQRYRERGGTVVTWTVKSHDDLARAREYADNVIFEGLDPVAVRRGAGEG